MRVMRSILPNTAAILVLTLLTQIGGLAWLCALAFRRKRVAFGLLYLGLWGLTIAIAPAFGRTPLSCWHEGPLQMKAWVFCLANRNYMAPELHAALEDTAERLIASYPDARVQVLDANFPFWTGFPLLPHLSHDDGEKVDLAFFYQTDGTPAGTRTPSPVGYFAFEPGPTDCPAAWLTLRWNMSWLQPLWPEMTLDEARTARLVALLAQDERISKILLEPHLKARFGIQSDKVRFQGCRAARHDDHIHVQL